MGRPKEVDNLSFSDDVRFDPFGGSTPIKVMRWTVGKQGPFRHEFHLGEFSDSAVERVLTESVRMLRETGAIT